MSRGLGSPCKPYCQQGNDPCEEKLKTLFCSARRGWVKLGESDGRRFIVSLYEHSTVWKRVSRQHIAVPAPRTLRNTLVVFRISICATRQNRTSIVSPLLCSSGLLYLLLLLYNRFSVCTLSVSVSLSPNH